MGRNGFHMGSSSDTAMAAVMIALIALPVGVIGWVMPTNNNTTSLHQSGLTTITIPPGQNNANTMITFPKPFSQVPNATVSFNGGLTVGSKEIQVDFDTGTLFSSVVLTTTPLVLSIPKSAVYVFSPLTQAELQVDVTSQAGASTGAKFYVEANDLNADQTGTCAVTDWVSFGTTAKTPQAPVQLATYNVGPLVNINSTILTDIQSCSTYIQLRVVGVTVTGTHTISFDKVALSVLTATVPAVCGIFSTTTSTMKIFVVGSPDTYSISWDAEVP